MDDYATKGLAKAKAAVEGGAFKAEITPVTIVTRKGVETVEQDEQPLKADPPRSPPCARPSAATAASRRPIPARSATAPPPW
jgi:acetyl-CoA C-acetyltransferase